MAEALEIQIKDIIRNIVNEEIDKNNKKLITQMSDDVNEKMNIMISDHVIIHFSEIAKFITENIKPSK